MSTNRVVIGATALLLAAALTSCAPEPSPTPGVSSTTPAPASASPTSATPTSAPTPTAGADDMALPADCGSIYSADMLATLEQENPPLNDPGVTMYSTENAALLETLQVVPTIRCSWGPAGERGLTTNVSLVDAAQSAAIAAELTRAGYGCEQQGGATICRIEQRGVSLDDVEYTRGETHALRGNAWISTAWLNFSPDGYTEDILATLWA